MSTFKLTKKERLNSTSLIGKLFEEGKSFYVFPLKVVFIKTTLPQQSPVQASFSVSKKNFKQAVHRNLLKRRMRETYRLNKLSLYESIPQDTYLALMFIYTCKEQKDYAVIEKSMKKILTKLTDTFN